MVKLVLSKVAGKPRVLERFRREVRALQKLQHPNVVGLVAWGTCAEHGRPYYAMPWCPGVPLSLVLEKAGKLSLERALGLADQLLSALEAAHALGIVHRDLKPDNLLIQEPGTVREHLTVLDFGLAKHLDVGGRTGEDLTGKGALGTPLYVPPEQCSGGSATPKTDVYAFGCVLMEMLTGEPPFSAETSLGIMTQHMTEAAPSLDERWPEAPPVLTRWVEVCLAKEQRGRPDAASLRRGLSAVRSGAVAAVPRTAVAAPPPKTVDAAASTPLPTPSSRVRVAKTADVPSPSPHRGRVSATRAKLEVEFGGRSGRLLLFAGETLCFGRNRREVGAVANDLVLRAFPRAGESAQARTKRTRAVSGHHGVFFADAQDLWVRDEGSTKGTRLDGVSLEARRARLLPQAFLLDVADAVTLRGRVFRSSPGPGIDALRLDRTRDGEEHSYLWLLRQATLGAGDADTIQLPHSGVVAGHARIAFVAGGYVITRLRKDAPLEVTGQGALAVGASVSLVSGAELRLGAARLRFSVATDDDMKP